jgi:hypothetical protein
MSHGDLAMDDAVFIYRNRSDARFYDASTGEMRGGPDQVIVYLDGVLCAMDHETKIAIPVSRWKLAEIGLACFLTALKGKGAATRSVEPVPRPKLIPEALPEPPSEAADWESSEARWERLMQEMRDLSRQ